MNDCDTLLGATGVEALSEETARAASPRIAALPIEDLMRAWHVTQTTGYPYRTPAIRAFWTYFDGLGHDDPERCVDLLDALVRDEPDDEIVAEAFDGKLVRQLAHYNLAKVADRLETFAAASSRWRRMLGAAYWEIERAAKDQGCGQGLVALVDRDAFRAWTELRKASRPEIEFETLTVADLARWWVKLNAASPVEQSRDDNASGLFDVQWTLANEDPERGLALVVAVLAIERDPMLLGLLAAGLLEDVIPAAEGPMLDAVILEAERDPRFRRLLAGVYYAGIEDAAVARLERVTDRSPGPI